jgi:serine/threonine protein kinase
MGLAVGGDEEADELAHVADLFPELRVEGRLARGGFGTVFRGEHRRMRRRVALKFLDALLAHSREAIDLFEQEMVSVGSLDHPGIVRAYDAGEREGRWFIVMELVEGLDCGALVRQHGRLPVAEACEIVRQAALALGHAHQRGLVHRDVKPGNLMVTRPAPGLPGGGVSEVKVLDFGLAGLSTGPALGSAVPGESSAPGRLMIGTLEYVAPEQIDHPETTDARADLYSLGATLWRLLTGKPPRRGGDRSLFRQMQRIVTEPIAPLATERPDLPRPLAQLCDRLLALDPDERPASAAELARLLEPWCAGAELARLFGEGPLAEKPFPRPDVLRRQRRLAVFAAATLGLGLLAGS